MPETDQKGLKIQWKWVGITFLLYLWFYIFPILLAGGVLTNKPISEFAVFFIGAWSFGGLIVIAALSGYLSKGVTLWEPAIGSTGLVILWFIVFQVFLRPKGIKVSDAVLPFLLITVMVFFISLLGAWLGERAQKLFKAKATQ